jgi:hypothetical protein
VKNTNYEAPQIISLLNFFELYVPSCPLVQNIPLSTQFSNTSSLRSSPIVTDQVSHTYKTAGRIKLTFSFPVRSSKDLGFPMTDTPSSLLFSVCLHLFIIYSRKSFSVPFSHLALGLPSFILHYIFLSNIFLATLAWYVLSTCLLPIQTGKITGSYILIFTQLGRL